MKKLNKKGFTLIELLAVIVILGLLMAIAIPSVTRYINQSRKKTVANSINGFITAVSTSVNELEYDNAKLTDGKFHYLPVSDNDKNSCVVLEKGGKNPFGVWDVDDSGNGAYVVVHYNSSSKDYEYYFTFIDSSDHFVPLTEANDIDQDSILDNSDSLGSVKLTEQLPSGFTIADGKTATDYITVYTATSSKCSAKK